MPRERPAPWTEGMDRIKHAWIVPFMAIEWGWEWAAYFLSNWKFLEVLEYLGSLSVLIAVLFYFSESGDRTKQKHDQAWQVINTAQGKGGSGGRIEALQELNADRVPLVGVDVSDAFLQGVRLEKANLLRSNLSAADLRESDFRFADLTESNLRAANFRGGDLSGANLHGADLQDSDLTGANLSSADLSEAILDNADLTGVTLRNIVWREIRSVKGTNIYGVQDAPIGFFEWALQHGAVQTSSSHTSLRSQMRRGYAVRAGSEVRDCASSDTARCAESAAPSCQPTIWLRCSPQRKIGPSGWIARS